jgi:Fe-S-cluster-containing hydrogenase component 2
LRGLKDRLRKDDKIFKLVCGAGNECAEEVERLVCLYSQAGCQMFDISAKPEILISAKKGLEKSGITKDRYICVSVGIKGDPHALKAKINKNACQQCNRCQFTCPFDSIKDCQVIYEKCLGCGKCASTCPANAIELCDTEKDLNLVLPELVEMGIDCIELHATSEAEGDIWEKWEIINKCFDGVLSICIDRLNLGNKQVLSRIKKMLESRKPYTTIIQADGIPMSGCDDEYKTTLQAVAMAEIIQDEKLPVHILISGGTNSKTARLAHLCGIEYKGIAIGSYARKIVKEFINNKDFYNDERIYSQALKYAKSLVELTLE